MTTDPFASLRFINGIGPVRAAALAAAGYDCAWDVLHAVPKLIGAPPPLVESGPLPPASAVRVRARVVQARPSFGRGRGMGVEAKLERADGMTLSARFFNAGYLRRHLIPGEWFLWEGRTDETRAGLLLHPAFTHLPGGVDQELPPEPACRVAYRAPEGVSERTMRELAGTCLDSFLTTVADPAGELTDREWQAVLRRLHQPADPTDHEAARRQLAERELFALAWRLQERRARVTSGQGQAWHWHNDTQARALARLPFTLTPGQQDAVAEIRADLQAAAPMYRLLNGDVGSGKTAVALLAMLAVIADGAQAALLAPTAVLARQHADFIGRCLAGSRVRTALLTGGTSAAERNALIDDLAAGRIGILIATHALLEDDLTFSKLGLLVIDEQHKFGVAQRGALVARAEAHQGWRPDLLLMTATPIPRTLALTAFGDLAVSRIAGRPPGRSAVTTRLAAIGGAGQLNVPLKDALAAGGQAFVICPLRDSSERVTAADAESVHRDLASRFADAGVGLLTGALPEAEKLSLMARFARGELRILVATTVVEVGVDVAAANLLIVLDAERFGLAQLHQLRGRIGRGSLPGLCLLLHRSDESPERLNALVAHDDGLAIAEADLASRGPGQLLGTGQSGAFSLRVAELPRDLDLLHDAHQRARTRIATGETMPSALARLLPTGDGLLLAGG